MSQQELDELRKELNEAKAREAERDKEIARLKEREILTEARAIVVEALAASKLPALTQKRLTESLVNGATVKDGALDREALTAAIEAAVTDATAELAEATGGNPVRGMGGGPIDTTETPKLEESQKRIDAAIAAVA